MKQAAREALTGNKSDYEKIRAIAGVYAIKKECSVQEGVMPKLWLCKIFPPIVLDTNMPEKYYKIFKKMKLMNYLIIALTYFSMICLTDA